MSYDENAPVASVYHGGTRIHIGGMNPATTEDDIIKVCEFYGALNDIDIKSNLRGTFCFVEFEDIRDAHDAVNALNGMDVAGAKVSVGFAKEKESYGDDHGGGVGRRGGRGWTDNKDSFGHIGRWDEGESGRWNDGGRRRHGTDDRDGGGRGRHGAEDRDGGGRGRRGFDDHGGRHGSNDRAGFHGADDHGGHHGTDERAIRGRHSGDGGGRNGFGVFGGDRQTSFFSNRGGRGTGYSRSGGRGGFSSDRDGTSYHGGGGGRRP